MTILDRSPVGDFLLGLIDKMRCFSHRSGWARNIAIMISLLTPANASPAHCIIQAYGKTVLDKTCDLIIKNDAVEMINPDGSYVSIAAAANNFFLATIHAIHDMAEPKPVPVSLTKDGECYQSGDGLSRFCAHKLAEGDIDRNVESSAPPQCNVYTTKDQHVTCEKWVTTIGVNIIQYPSSGAGSAKINNEKYKYIYLHIPEFLNITRQKYGLVTAGVTDFVVTWSDHLKSYFDSHAKYLSRMRMAFSEDDSSVDDKFSAMRRAVDNGSNCETVTAVRDGHITYAFILMQTDKVKECFASSIAQGLGAKHLSKSDNPADEMNILDNLKKIYRQ